VYDVVSIVCLLMCVVFVNLVCVAFFDSEVSERYWAWAKRHWRKPRRFCAMIPPCGPVLVLGLAIVVFWEWFDAYLTRRDR
jgi:ABC-type transport system involved in cytochrome c biogenesis permease subunit